MECRRSIRVSTGARPLLTVRMMTGIMSLALLSLGSLEIILPKVSAAVFSGGLSGASGFVFLASFCYDYAANPDGLSGNLEPVAGQLIVNISLAQPFTAGSSPPPLSFALFDDEPSSWPYVLSHSDMTCMEKSSMASSTGRMLNIVWDPDTGTGYRAVSIYQHARPRFWYLTLVACDSVDGDLPIPELSYTAHFLNINAGVWGKEFGSNEQSLNSIFIVATACFTVLLILALLAQRSLIKHLSYWHPLLRLVFVVLILEWLSVSACVIHYCLYTFDGVGVLWLQRLGIVLAVTSHVVFLLLLILLAFGWAIASDATETVYWSILRYFNAGLVIALGLLDLTIFAEEWIFADPRITSETRVSLALRWISVFLYVAFASYYIAVILLHSLPKEKVAAKRRLYYRLLFFFVPLMVGPPLVSVLVMLLDDWERLRIVTGVSVLSTFIAYAALAILLRPSVTKEYFAIYNPTSNEGLTVSLNQEASDSSVDNKL